MIYSGLHDRIDWFLNKNPLVPINNIDFDGMNVLVFCIINSQNIDVFKCLIKHGADINFANGTILAYAIETELEDFIRVLIDADVYINIDTVSKELSRIQNTETRQSIHNIIFNTV